MRWTAHASLALLLSAATLSAAGSSKILLVARDNDGHLLAGFRFAYGAVESRATNRAGAAELSLPPEHPPGMQIKIYLASGPKRSEEWFLVNSQANIPRDSGSAEVVLMRRSTFRQIAASARDTTQQATDRRTELTAEERKLAQLRWPPGEKRREAGEGCS